MSLIHKLAERFVGLTEQERRQFRAEQVCRITFAKLPRVVRVFV